LEQSRREAEHERERAETLRRREILKATHELQQLEIERQVWEEESECGGHLPLDDAAMNAVASIKNVSWKQNVKAEPSSAAVTKLPSFSKSTFTRTNKVT